MKNTEFILRTRNADGKWEFDFDTVMTKQQAESAATLNRLLGGLSSQIWNKSEAIAHTQHGA